MQDTVTTPSVTRSCSRTLTKRSHAGARIHVVSVPRTQDRRPLFDDRHRARECPPGSSRRRMTMTTRNRLPRPPHGRRADAPTRLRCAVNRPVARSSRRRAPLVALVANLRAGQLDTVAYCFRDAGGKPAGVSRAPESGRNRGAALVRHVRRGSSLVVDAIALGSPARAQARSSLEALPRSEIQSDD